MTRTLLILTLLSSTALAQQPRKFTVDWTDAALVGAMIGDEASTAACKNCREVGALKSTPGRIGFKFGLFAAVKAVEYYNPGHGRAFMWTKLLMATAFGAATVNNLLQAKRR